jgi:hypothetical protein
MEPDGEGLKGIRAYERFRGSGKESLREREDLPPSLGRPPHMFSADGHGHSAHNMATTPTGHAHAGATTAGHDQVKARKIQTLSQVLISFLLQNIYSIHSVLRNCWERGFGPSRHGWCSDQRGHVPLGL